MEYGLLYTGTHMHEGKYLEGNKQKRKTVVLGLETAVIPIPTFYNLPYCYLLYIFKHLCMFIKACLCIC